MHGTYTCHLCSHRRRALVPTATFIATPLHHLHVHITVVSREEFCIFDRQIIITLVYSVLVLAILIDTWKPIFILCLLCVQWSWFIRTGSSLTCLICCCTSYVCRRHLSSHGSQISHVNWNNNKNKIVMYEIMPMKWCHYFLIKIVIHEIMPFEQAHLHIPLVISIIVIQLFLYLIWWVLNIPLYIQHV